MKGGGKMDMAGGVRPPMGGQPPEGIPAGNFPQPPERMDNEAMTKRFENKEGAPNEFKMASIGFLLVGADSGKYWLIILTAFGVMFFAWLVKKKY